MVTDAGSQGKLVSERSRPGSSRSAFQAAQAASTEDWVRSAAFSPDGTRIVTGSDDITARVWWIWRTVEALVREAGRRLPRQLTAEQEVRFGLRE